MSVQPAALSFPPLVLPPEAEKLRREVREFLLVAVPRDRAPERFKSWGTFSPEFSEQLGA
ncbi:MAG: hypothetical protein K0S54_2761, partial [Alphaproteobacteria bacterium]|nr:hypothetical protein [Alphaproteobacteria bacterium]